MDEKAELTNVPDYQKIRQTSQSNGGQGWSEDVETLVPSPVVRPPGGQASTTSPRPHTLMQVRGGHPSISSNQQSQHHFHEGKASYSLDTREKSPSPPVYIPQGYSRPVTKYIDANGVERRFIRTTVSPNRRSFTEGLLMKGDGSGPGSIPGAGTALLRHASSHKNLYHQEYPSTATGNISEGTSRGEFGNFVEDRAPAANRHSFSNVQTQQKAAVGSSSYPGLFHQSPGGGEGGDDQWKQIGGSHLILKKHQEGLRHWQQQHQEELLHQHLETQALYESPSNQSVINDQSFSKRSIQDEPPARWEPVRRAADTIIREKNMIIDKLKNRILELEEDFKESESKLRQALMSRDDDADIAKDKLQGLQHSNATLKERLNEERAKKNSEIDDLELKLGSAEHEIQKLKEVLRNKSSDVSDIQSQLVEKNQEAEAWHIKFKESCDGHQDLKKKLDGLQRYLNELPTVEESQMQAQQLLSLREENVALKTRCEGLDKKLSQVRKVITARDFRIRDLEEKERELQHKVEEVNQELERLRDTEGSEFFNTQKELEHVRSEKERLAIDLEKAKKLLETTHLKLRQVEVKYQGEAKTAKERLTQEEETVISLKNEVADRERQIAKMKRSMKELGAQNQEQLEENLVLKQQLRHSGHSPRQHLHHTTDDASSTGSSGYSSSSLRGRSRSGSGESGSMPALQRQLVQQLGLCFSELQTLVNVCFQRARGEDPDISVLLGVKSPGKDEAIGGELEGTEVSGDQTKTISHWLTKVADLRREVDRLRAHICNKYAEDMGDNITCATQ